MNAVDSIRHVFVNWSPKAPRRGLLVTHLNEAVTFKGFMLRGDLLLLERQNPDALGARYVMLTFDQVAAVKLIDPLPAEAFAPWGFEGALAGV